VAIVTKRKSARKRYDPRRQEILSGRVKHDREGHDCVCAAQADEIPPIRAEIATARVQTLNPACVANDPSIRGDRQDPIGPAV
jgi:hypothetical protein